KTPEQSLAFSELEYYNTQPVRVPNRQMKAVYSLSGGQRYKLIICPSIARGSDSGKHINGSNYRNRVWEDLLEVGGRQLFDLSADPGEKRNISKAHPDIVGNLENS